jgi:hypothetical protein
MFFYYLNKFAPPQMLDYNQATSGDLKARTYYKNFQSDLRNATNLGNSTPQAH